MYQINDYRGTGRTTQLLALCREENAIFICYNSIRREELQRKYTDIEIMTYLEVLKYGVPNNRKYVIDDMEHFVSYAISTGTMIGYSVEKPLPPQLQNLISP